MLRCSNLVAGFWFLVASSMIYSVLLAFLCTLESAALKILSPFWETFFWVDLEAAVSGLLPCIIQWPQTWFVFTFFVWRAAARILYSLFRPWVDRQENPIMHCNILPCTILLSRKWKCFHFCSPKGGGMLWFKFWNGRDYNTFWSELRQSYAL